MKTIEELPRRNLNVPAVRNLAILLVALLPLALVSLWVAQRGSHGHANRCEFDRTGRFATFLFFSNYFVEVTSGRSQNLRFRSFDLETNQQLSEERLLSPTITVGPSSVVSALSRDEFELNQWNDAGAMNCPIVFNAPTVEKFALSSTAILDGMVLCFLKRATSRLELVDPKNKVIRDTIEFDYIQGYMDPIWGTNYFCIVSTANVTAPTNLLGRVKDGKIEMLGEWGAEFIGAVQDESGDVVVGTLSADSKSVELRTPDSRELKRIIELPPTQFGPFASRQIMLSRSWISIVSTRNVFQFVDAYSGKILPVPASFRIVERDLVSKRLLVSSIVQAKSMLIDEESGKVINEIATGTDIVGAKFIDDGRHLLVGNTLRQVFEIDTLTGNKLRVFDKYWFIPYLELLSAIGFIVWACFWLRNSAKIHNYAWFDCAWITCLCVGYIIIRSRLTGFQGDVIRPIYQLSEGIFATWMILSSLWLVLGRTRLSLRILPQIGVTGLVCLLAMVCVGFQNQRVWELVIAVGLLSVWLVVVTLPMRFLGYRLIQIHPSKSIERNDAISKGAVSLRDLFMLTAVIAGVMAVAKIAPSGMQVTVVMVTSLFMLVCSVTITGIAAVRVGLSRRSWVNRLLWLGVAIAIGMFLPLVWNAVNRGWNEILAPDMNFLFWEMRLHGATALATAFCLFAFRLRGWRLIRASSRRTDHHF